VRTSGSSNAADEESRRIWMIIAGLAGVGVLVALLTWRYWLLTRPGLDLDEPGDAYGPGADLDPYGGQPAREGYSAMPPPGRPRKGGPPAGAKPRRSPGPAQGEHSPGRRRSPRGADPFWDDPGTMGPGGAVTGRPPSRGPGPSPGGPGGPPPGARQGARRGPAPNSGQGGRRRPPAQGGPPPSGWGPAEDVDMWGNPRRG
jgi:hypothetical protein